MFRRYGVDEAAFWREANSLAGIYREQGILASEVQYLNHILAHVRSGKFHGLSNDVLRSFGSELTFFPGALDFLQRIAERITGDTNYASHDIRVEHYR